MKGWLAVVCCLCLCMGASGCSGWAANQKIDKLESQVEELKQELATVREVSGEPLGEETPPAEPSWEEWMPWRVVWKALLRESQKSAEMEGQYWCMGKGDSCQNPTSGPLDLYCDSCDPNGDNRED